MKRGDILVAAIPNNDGSPPKNRPVLVVQADFYNQRIRNVLVAHITSNLTRAGDPAHLLIEILTPEGAKSGLQRDSLVSCLNIAVVVPADIQGKIGELSDPAMKKIDECLKSAFGIS